MVADHLSHPENTNIIFAVTTFETPFDDFVIHFRSVTYFFRVNKVNVAVKLKVLLKSYKDAGRWPLRGGNLDVPPLPWGRSCQRLQNLQLLNGSAAFQTSTENVKLMGCGLVWEATGTALNSLLCVRSFIVSIQSEPIRNWICCRFTMLDVSDDSDFYTAPGADNWWMMASFSSSCTDRGVSLLQRLNPWLLFAR